MATSTLVHQVTVGSVPFTKDIDTRINIKKRHETVVYRTLSNRDNINISYIAGESITPNDNLSISDKSTSLTQNRIPSTQTVTTTTTKSLTLNVDKFLVTDEFTTEQPTLPATPLFFAHKLKNYNSDLSTFANLTVLSIEFTDHTLKLKNITDYSLDTTTGNLYNNIENEYNTETEVFDITLVKYSVKNTSTNEVNVYHELINNLPAFQQADFDDLDSSGNIISGRKRYLIEEQPGLSSFLITLPVFTKYAYKETPQSRIRVLPPTAIDISTPWNVRITNGQFIMSLQKTVTSSINHKYYIPEFDTQIFQPFPPYVQEAEQKAIWIYDNIIYVPKHIAFDQATFLNLDVIVKDSVDEVKYAFTTDTDKVGLLYQGSTSYTAGILSVDQPNGFIELSEKILETDTILVTYYAEEKELEFLFDFNPANNLDVLNQRVVIYVNPETVFTGELGQSVYYLLVDPLGKITFASQPLEGNSDPATQKLLSEDFSSEGLPSHDFYYDIESTQSGLNSRVSGVNTQFIDEFSFVDKYTVDSVLLDSSTPSGTATAQNFEDNSRFLVLADVSVGENQSIQGLTDFDIRIRGGGIKEDNYRLAIQEQPEVAWYWDSDIQRPYPAANAFMVEVPESLLSINGGRFTSEQIRDVVERHMDASSYAIIKTYGIDPVLTSLTVSSGEVTIGWPSYGSDVSYSVYQSSSIEDSTFSGVSSSLSDVALGNSFIVSGLTPSTKYFLKVGATGSENIESFSQTISATTTSSEV